MNENEMEMVVDWTKQSPEMNEHDKIFCDTLYRTLRVMKIEELAEPDNQGAATEEISQEVQNV